MDEADVEENKLLKESLEKLIESQETCQQLQSDMDWVIKFQKPRAGGPLLDEFCETLIADAKTLQAEILSLTKMVRAARPTKPKNT